MFSSELFTADLFLPNVERAPSRPAILGDGASGDAWLPDTLDAGDGRDAFDTFDADGVPFGDAFDAPNAARPNGALVARQDVEAAAREALAERELEEAARLEEARAEAYAAGVEAGHAAAEAAAHDALSSAIQALWLATEEVRAGEARWHAALEDNVAALVAGAARHVIAREVSADDALVRELAARAVAEYPQDHPVHVRVHPADLATLKAAFATTPRPGELRWTADARVERGGCVVEGRERIVDGRVDTALERVYRTLSGHHA